VFFSLAAFLLFTVIVPVFECHSELKEFWFTTPLEYDLPSSLFLLFDPSHKRRPFSLGTACGRHVPRKRSRDPFLPAFRDAFRVCTPLSPLLLKHFPSFTTILISALHTRPRCYFEDALLRATFPSSNTRFFFLRNPSPFISYHNVCSLREAFFLLHQVTMNKPIF